jgi:hypothetical protein
MRRTVLPVFVGQSIRFRGSRRQEDSLAISVADDRRFNGEGRSAANEGLDRIRGARLDWRHRESRPSTAGHLRPTGPGPAGSSQEGHEDRGSFFVFRPPGHVHQIDRAPRCTPKPSSPGSRSWRPRRPCEAWRCRVPPRWAAWPHGEVWKRVRRIRAAIRGSVVRISETPWEVLRCRARTAPPGAGAGSKAPCLPDATGEAGRLSVAVQDLFDNSGSGERNSAVRVETRRGKERPAWRTRLPVPCDFSAPRGAPAGCADQIISCRRVPVAQLAKSAGLPLRRPRVRSPPGTCTKIRGRVASASNERAPVAQMAGAPDRQSGGRGFESLQVLGKVGEPSMEACARSSAGAERRITDPEAGGSNPSGHTEVPGCKYACSSAGRAPDSKPGSRGVRFPPGVLMFDSKKVDFLRERRARRAGRTAGGARPKDLLSGRWEPDSRCDAGPAVLPARSFGRRTDFPTKAGAARRLPQEVIAVFPQPV